MDPSPVVRQFKTAHLLLIIVLYTHLKQNVISFPSGCVCVCVCVGVCVCVCV